MIVDRIYYKESLWIYGGICIIFFSNWGKLGERMVKINGLYYGYIEVIIWIKFFDVGKFF